LRWWDLFVFSALQTLEGADIQALDLKAEKAGAKADDALTKSGTALSQAGVASDTAKGAVDKSDKATRAAANAMSLATGARKEADSFEKDIKSAKEQSGEAKTLAGEAKSLLTEVRRLASEAQSRATSAEVRVGGIESKVADRHITPAQADSIHKELAKWADIELLMAVINGDGESWTFANELLVTLGTIPGWSISLFELGSNSGMSGLAVRITKDASEAEKGFALDLVSALHNGGVQATGPTLPPFRGTISGGGRTLVTGTFNSQDPRFDPTSAKRTHNVTIEISKKP
jgi:hypothetical protein